LRCDTKNLAAFLSRPLDFRYITFRRIPNITNLIIPRSSATSLSFSITSIKSLK
jgi:hypothetical protein